MPSLPVSPCIAVHPERSNRFERRVGNVMNARAISRNLGCFSAALLAFSVVFVLATAKAQAHPRERCSASNALPAGTCAQDTREDSNQASAPEVDPIVRMQRSRGHNESDDQRSPYRSLALLTGLMLALYIELTALHRIVDRLKPSQHP